MQQNMPIFLVIDLFLCVICRGIKASDIVLEVGPGTGNLTVRLLEVSKRVIAVEFDKRMVREVLKRVETMVKHSLSSIVLNSLHFTSLYRNSTTTCK